MRHLIATMFVSASLFSVSAYAADDHHHDHGHDHLHSGDIEIEVEGGKLGTHGAGHFQEGSGYAIFEGDFRDLAGGPYRTNAPGFDSHAGTFDQGDIIGYQAIGNLWSWNGSSWTNTVLNGETLSLTGNWGENTVWSTTGVSGDAIGLLGQAGSSGNIHEHLNFEISSSSGLPTDGAYFVTLQLLSVDLNSTGDGFVAGSKYASSDPFYLIFNNGLSADEFHTALHGLEDNLIAAVPEPSTYAMFLAGLGLMGWQLRRRQQA